MTFEEKEFIMDEFEPALADAIKWLFERPNIDGLFAVFFILYSYRHNLPVTFNEDGVDYQDGIDSLQDRLYDASLLSFGGDCGQFAYLEDVQELIESIEKETFDESYSFLVDVLLNMTDLAGGTQMRPNARIAFTISKILKEHGCKTVYGAFSGIGVYALACEGMKYTGAEPYAPANLIAEVLCDAFDVKKVEFYDDNPLDPWTRRKFDAVIGNLPVDVDFFNVFRADRFLFQFNEKQDEFIKKLIKRKTARKTAALLIHFEFANYGRYDDTRKLICDNGLLEAVIALPEDIFREALVPTYLLILDMEGGHTQAEFMDARESFRRQGYGWNTIVSNRFDLRECVNESERVTASYEQIARCAWSFNPAVYIQNAVAREGQELVRMGDLVSVVYGKHDVGPRFVGYERLSESFSNAVAGITPSVPSRNQVMVIEGPSVLISLSRGSRREIQKLVCGICRDYGSYGVDLSRIVLKPNPETILPDYLVLALMSDPSFADYLKRIQEYYTDDVRQSHLLERRIPIITDLAAQKKAVTEALGRADMADISYNIVIAGAGDRIAYYRRAFSKYGCVVLAGVESVEGYDGLERLLEESSSKKTPVSQKPDAVVFLTDIPLNKNDNEEPFAGLDAILDLKLLFANNGVKFFAVSRCPQEDILKAGTISSRRLKPLMEGHFFMTDGEGNPTDALTASVREELDRDLSPDARIRSRHMRAFKAAEWLDETYPDMEIHAAETLSDFLKAAEEGIDTTRNLSELRNIAHRILEILSKCRAVPPIDNGSIPHLLYDKDYNDTNKGGKVYIQDIPIMNKSLSASLISLIDIGNEGTHTFKSSANLGSSMLNTLLEFITWFYDRRDEFSTALTNYWHVASEFERPWEESTGPAELRTVSGKQFWICGNVHLRVPKNFDIQEGDIVTIRKRVVDTGEIKIPGVDYYAFPKGYHGKNPDGYTVKTSGRGKPQSE